MPLNYVWNQNVRKGPKNTWQKRERGGDKILPRLYSVSPKDREKFALRLLLLHVKGACSYEDLRTVNGTSFDTFQEAAKALSLLEDDREWEKTLAEAANFRMPREMRSLFAMILIHGVPTDADILFEKFKNAMTEDFLYTNMDQYLAEQFALENIQTHLQQFGKNLAQFNLPDPQIVFSKYLFGN